MRNLLKYPVTYDEKVQLIESLIKENDEKQKLEEICGDMIGTILEEILKDIVSMENSSQNAS